LSGFANPDKTTRSCSEKLAGCTGLEGVENQARTLADQPSMVPQLPAPFPPLRIVPAATLSDVPGVLPPVTSELFIEAAALAALQTPGQGAWLLRRGLEQAASLA
jgi:hypothetical protein